MQKIEIPGNAIVKVVDRYNLDLSIQDGWKLVYAYPTKEPVSIMRTVPTPESARQGSYPPPTQTYSDQEMVETQMFVMVKDEASLVATQAATISRLESALAVAESDRRCFKEKAETLGKELSEETAHSARLSDAVKALRVERDEVLKTQRKMEADLGKVRESIGKKAMTDILGESK